MISKNTTNKNKEKKIYKRLEGRKSHREISSEERSTIQAEINKLNTGIQEYVNAYKQANPEKQIPEIQATTNNKNITTPKSANPTERKLNASIPTSRTLSTTQTQKTRTRMNNNKNRTKKRNTSVKMIKH